MSKNRSENRVIPSVEPAAPVANGPVDRVPPRDLMSLFGSLHSPIPYDPQEKQKARAAMGRHAARSC
ncbi:MAG: hypothetical protein ABSH22_07875 [Tepidisphaeraceae bacterium]